MLLWEISLTTCLILKMAKRKTTRLMSSETLMGMVTKINLESGELTKQIRRPYSGRSREALVAGLNSRLSAVATMASGTRYT